MIGLVAKFPLQNPRDFAQMDGGIELFQVEDIPRNGVGIAGRVRPACLGPPIAEAVHAFEDKAPGFVAHHSPLHPGLPTALCRCFGEEDNGR